MNWLADNALLIWLAGAIALTTAIVVYFHTHSGKALVGIITVLAAMAALLAIEHFIETPREAVERTLYALAATVEANDLPGTLAFFAPSTPTEIRDDVGRMMPLVKIERARVLGTPQIEVAAGDDPASATVVCRGLIVATVKQNGMKGGVDDELTFAFIRDGNRWMLENYTSKRNWNRAMGR